MEEPIACICQLQASHQSERRIRVKPGHTPLALMEQLSSTLSGHSASFCSRRQVLDPAWPSLQQSTSSLEDFEELLNDAAIFLVCGSANMRNRMNVAPATGAISITIAWLANVCAILVCGSTHMRNRMNVAPATGAISITVAWLANSCAILVD